MKTNKQSKIKVPRSGHKRSRFNWSHDVNTTYSWGELQPTVCKLLIPGSKTTMQTQDLVRLAPMVAPTFGRVRYKTYSQFVGMSDIFPNYSALMAEEPVSTGYKTQVPTNIPIISLGLLSTYVLQGARATLYWIDPGSSDVAGDLLAGNYRTSYRRSNGVGGYSVPSDAQTMLGILTATGSVNQVGDPYDSANTGIQNVGVRTTLVPSLITSAWDALYSGEVAGSRTRIVLGNRFADSLIPIDRADDQTLIPDEQREVTFDSADYVIEFKVLSGGTYYYYAIALECSDFGKRVRKAIQGCGYQVDFASLEHVSILPLLAQYKAYFDIFGLTLYQNWETTFAYKLIKYTQNTFGYDVGISGYQYPQINSNMTTVFGSNNPQAMLFVQFMYQELANEWFTDAVDFVSANIEKLAVSPNSEDISGQFLTVDSNGVRSADYHFADGHTVVPTTGIDSTQVDYAAASNGQINLGTSSTAVHAFINSVEHGEIDSELLKRMYKWTNRNTILGRVIADLLRAQGLGKYVDECKSNYIGSSDTMVTISDVVSLADTSVPGTNDGAVLGQYGGRGLQYDQSGTLVFENDECGYWITLATIVPESGYVQGLDMTLTATTKWALYNPDFDGLGMELTKKAQICGCRYLQQNDSTQNDTALNTGFGFVPMYSKFKIAQNLVNGDFNRHNMRNVYLPYTLDKQLTINDYDDARNAYVQAGAGSYSYAISALRRSVTTLNMPVAGNVWRMPTKFAWLGNFNRIFVRVGERAESGFAAPDVNVMVGFSDYNDDQFLTHSVCDMQCYAPMKPIEDSYGLEEDDPMKNGADFKEKA